MKIALISVAPPYRGGISKHTSILIDKLSGKHSVDLINYSRQYPDFIFPGILDHCVAFFAGILTPLKIELLQSYNCQIGFCEINSNNSLIV